MGLRTFYGNGPHILLWGGWWGNFFTTLAAYKCGRGLHNTTWRTSCGPRAVVWRPVVENVVNNKAVGEEKTPYPSTDIIQEQDSLIESEII